MTKIELLTLTDNVLDKKVKIQGTKYDRKRKISDATIKKMNKLAEKGKTVQSIAQELGLTNRAVRYHTDAAWRKAYIASCSGAHTGKDHISKLDRIAYKRGLVAAGKVTA